MDEENTKQVIVIRKDLKMRTGKAIAQGSHASMAFLTKGSPGVILDDFGISGSWFEKFIDDKYVEEVNHWLQSSFRKVVCYVESEQELDELHQKALNRGMMSHMIEDNGTTEFNGVKTKTCIAIGPHYDNMFEGLTDDLKLL
jgi:PTH2 family peptidyl-tRNA hydrolase